MKLVLGNIVEMEADAIATSAHSDLKPTPGISEAIFKAADTEKLMKICSKIGRCRIGQVVITPLLRFKMQIYYSCCGLRQVFRH